MGLSCLIGSAALLLPALTIGASGCVDGPLSLAPDVWVNIWAAYHSGNIEVAEAEQDRAAELYTIFRRVGYIASLKALLSEKLGIDCGAPARATSAHRRGESLRHPDGGGTGDDGNRKSGWPLTVRPMPISIADALCGTFEPF